MATLVSIRVKTQAITNIPRAADQTRTLKLARDSKEETWQTGEEKESP